MSLQLIVDECLAESTVSLLRELGFKIVRISSILSWGAEDEDIFRFASHHQIPLITHDRRFGQIYFDYVKEPATTIILQVQSHHPEATNTLLRDAFSKINLTTDKFKGKLILISSSRIRIRQKSSP